MTMRQARFDRFGGAEVIEVREVDEPTPGDGEALVRIDTAALGMPDIHYRNGAYPFPQPLPATPGWEGTGVVEALGGGVTDVAVGGHVYLTALLAGEGGRGFACEKAVVPAGSLVPLPEELDLHDAVALGNYVYARAALTLSGGVPGSLLQVGAAGSVGTAFVQVAAALGVTVIGTAGSAEKAAFVRESGAAHTIDHRAENVITRTLELTGGRGVDMVVDHLGGHQLPAYFDALAPYGTVVVLNTELGPSGTDLLEPFRHAKRWPAIRFFAGHGFADDPAGFREHADAVIDLMVRKTLRPRIGARLALTDIARAQELVEHGTLGRVLLHPRRSAD